MKSPNLRLEIEYLPVDSLRPYDRNARKHADDDVDAIALAYIPSAIDYADGAMRTLFSLNLRISLASMVMYCAANLADVYLYSRLKERGGAMWIRNNVSTILCNCLENFGFIGLAFGGIYDFQTIMIISLSTSAIEALVALCDTPFLYLARRIGHGKEVA